MGGFSLRVIVIGSSNKGSSFLLFFRPLWVGIRTYGDGTIETKHMSWDFFYISKKFLKNMRFFSFVKWSEKHFSNSEYEQFLSYSGP